MVTATQSRLGQTAAFARAHGGKFALEVAFNFVLPFAIYDLGNARLGNVGALMASSAPPVLWSVVTFIRERKVDAISMVVLSGIVLSLLAFAGTGGVKFLQLRENLAGGLVGLIFLGSAAIGRPLLYPLARAGAARRSPDAAKLLEALRDDTAFRRAMFQATLVWGVGLVGLCATNATLVFTVTIKQYLLMAGPISYAVIGALTAWAFWFVPRKVREALARRVAANQIESIAR